MIHQPKVIITAMLCATAIVLAFVGGIVFLAATGKGTEALVGAVVTPIVAALVTVMARSREVGEKVKALEQAVVNSPNIATPDR